MELSARIGDGFAWYHPDFGTHHEVTAKCFLKPGASLADDAPVDIPRVIATDEYHIAKGPVSRRLHSMLEDVLYGLSLKEETHLRSLDIKTFREFSKLGILEGLAMPWASGSSSEPSS